MKGLFAQQDLAVIDEVFEKMSRETIPGHFEPDLQAGVTEPLKRYPRIMHPHRFDETAKNYMLHEPVLAVLADLFEEEPLAAQSMFYFKPRVPADKRCIKIISI